MCIVQDTKNRAGHGRGGTHANRAEQAVKNGVVAKEEPKQNQEAVETIKIKTDDSGGERTLTVVSTVVGHVERDNLGQLRVGTNKFANF